MQDDYDQKHDRTEYIDLTDSIWWKVNFRHCLAFFKAS
jgi:hypothetical protein